MYFSIHLVVYAIQAYIRRGVHDLLKRECLIPACGHWGVGGWFGSAKHWVMTVEDWQCSRSVSNYGLPTPYKCIDKRCTDTKYLHRARIVQKIHWYPYPWLFFYNKITQIHKFDIFIHTFSILTNTLTHTYLLISLYFTFQKWQNNDVNPDICVTAASIII